MKVIYILSCLLFTVYKVSTQPILNTATTNITQTSGLPAVLTCQVRNLGSASKVIWIGPSGSTLTYGRQRITPDDRFSVERPYQNDWNLHIRQVKPRDAGEYICKVTTTPPQTKRVNLIIKVSPTFDHVLSSKSPTEVDEGKDLSLTCKVSAEPPAKIVWFFIHPSKPNEKKQIQASVTAESITIYNISRNQAGIYQCTAFNGIPPTSTRNITVNVKFPPVATTIIKKISQYRGKDTLIECLIQAYPMDIAVWKKGDFEIKENTLWKFVPTIFRNSDSEYLLTLQIFSLETSDFGLYTCEASNPNGKSTDTVLVQELAAIKPPTTTTSTSTTTITTTTMLAASSSTSTPPAINTTLTLNFKTTTTTENGVIIDEKNSSNNGGLEPPYSVLTTPAVRPPDGQDGSKGSAGRLQLTWSGVVLTFIVVVLL